MNLEILKNTLTPEQIKIIKAGLADQIQAGMNCRGVRDNGGKLILKYAFLKKRHIKKVKYMKICKCENDKLVVFRVL